MENIKRSLECFQPRSSGPVRQTRLTPIPIHFMSVSASVPWARFTTLVWDGMEKTPVCWAVVGWNDPLLAMQNPGSVTAKLISTCKNVGYTASSSLFVPIVPADFFFFLTTVRLPQFVGVCTVLCIHEIIRNRWNFICMLHTLTPTCRLVNLNHISFWIRKKKKYKTVTLIES